MNFVKSLIIFIISCCILYLFYSYVSIPIICVYALYIYIFWSDKWNCYNTPICNLLFIVLSIIGVVVYGINVCFAIRYYPEYGNVLSIIFDVLDVLSLISGSLMFLGGMIAENEKKRNTMSVREFYEYLQHDSNTMNDDISEKDMLVQKRNDE